jgi:hypothetical protein
MGQKPAGHNGESNENVSRQQENAGTEENASVSDSDVAIKQKNSNKRHTESKLDFPVKSLILACLPLFALAS